MVAAALRRSPVAAKTWTQLYDALNLDDLTKREYEMLVEMGYITYEDLFLRIMVQWVSIEGANATWKSLVGAIKQTGDRKTNGEWGAGIILIFNFYVYF